MNSDSWQRRLSTYTRRYRSKPELDIKEDEANEVEDSSKVEYICPFCGAEGFDVVGLYCHMEEEHPLAAKCEVCPICRKRLGQDVVTHIIKEHGHTFSISFLQAAYSGFQGGLILNASRKEWEANMQSLNGSSQTASSALPETDSLLSSFVCTPPSASVKTPLIAEPNSSCEASGANAFDVEEPLFRSHRKLPITSEEREEASRKCEFVRGLLLSTILDDNAEDLYIFV